MNKFSIILVLFPVVVVNWSCVTAMNNGLVLKPPLGWMSWMYYTTDIRYSFPAFSQLGTQRTYPGTFAVHYYTTPTTQVRYIVRASLRELSTNLLKAATSQPVMSMFVSMTVGRLRVIKRRTKW